MTEQQILDKYFFIKTDNVQQSQLMIPKLRSVMRKLTNKKWYQNKNNIDSTELDNELRTLRDFRSHLQNICVGCYNSKPQTRGGLDNTKSGSDNDVTKNNNFNFATNNDVTKLATNNNETNLVTKNDITNFVTNNDATNL